MKRWYVVHTQARQEVRAEVNLRRQGFEVWLPLIRRARRHARRVDSTLTATFSSLSIRSIGSHQRALALDQRDVRSRSFAVQRRYAPCCPRRIGGGDHGKMRRGGHRCRPPRRLVVGESVKVAMGRFDLEGLFETRSGQDRVVLLVNCWAARCGQASRSEDWRHKNWHFRFERSVAAGRACRDGAIAPVLR